MLCSYYRGSKNPLFGILVGLTETFDQALSVVCKGGRSVITGIFEEKLCSQQLRDSMVREVNVIGTSSYCWDFEKAILLASYGRIDLKSLITNKILNPTINSSGYYQCGLYKNKKQTKITVHKIMAISFIDSDKVKRRLSEIVKRKLLFIPLSR